MHRRRDAIKLSPDMRRKRHGSRFETPLRVMYHRASMIPLTTTIGHVGPGIGSSVLCSFLKALENRLKIRTVLTISFFFNPSGIGGHFSEVLRRQFVSQALRSYILHKQTLSCRIFSWCSSVRAKWKILQTIKKIYDGAWQDGFINDSRAYYR